MIDRIPASWLPMLRDELTHPATAGLVAFVAEERQRRVVYPPAGEEFTALALTPFDAVRVVIVGQDPYHGPGQAHGLAFSVRPGVRPPPSLTNIFRELKADIGCGIPGHGSLVHWARQGVLLLNAVLTVREGEPNSHRGRGWERLTDAVLRAVAAKPEPVFFILWGAAAQRKATLLEGTPHEVLRGVHPSPLSARRGFFGSRPFSTANAALVRSGRPPIEWCLLPETG